MEHPSSARDAKGGFKLCEMLAYLFSLIHCYSYDLAHAGLSTRVVPLGQLHSAVLVQVLVHIIGVPQQMRLVSPSLPQALELGLVEVVLENGLVIRVSALVNDDPGTLAR